MGTHPIFESDFDCLTEKKMGEIWENHRGKIVGAAVGVVAAPVALSAAGFTAGGVAAGSLAAGVQSFLYGASTTGAFSAAQSAGVLGVSWTTAGAAATGGGYFGSYFDKKK